MAGKLTDTTKPLYLGKYIIYEDIAPFGYVESKTPFEVELKYAGQEITISNETVEIDNEMQK